MLSAQVTTDDLASRNPLPSCAQRNSKARKQPSAGLTALVVFWLQVPVWLIALVHIMHFGAELPAACSSVPHTGYAAQRKGERPGAAAHYGALRTHALFLTHDDRNICRVNQSCTAVGGPTKQRPVPSLSGSRQGKPSKRGMPYHA